MLVAAAIDGFGIAYVTEDYVRQPVADGQLVRILEDWSPQFPGFPSLLSRKTTTLAGLCACR